MACLPRALLRRLPRVARSSSSRVAFSSSSLGTARLTRPHSSAVAASMTSPVSASSIARLRPTLRATGTIGVWQNQPPLPPGAANPAFQAATARSQVATSWQPAAVASPCTRAITTWGTDWIVSISSRQASSSVRAAARSAPARSAKSCPAEKTGPLPARMIPVASVSPTWRNASVRARMCDSDRALRRRGRFMVMTANGPSVSTSTSSELMSARYVADRQDRHAPSPPEPPHRRAGHRIRTGSPPGAAARGPPAWPGWPGPTAARTSARPRGRPPAPPPLGREGRAPRRPDLLPAARVRDGARLAPRRRRGAGAAQDRPPPVEAPVRPPVPLLQLPRGQPCGFEDDLPGVVAVPVVVEEPARVAHAVVQARAGIGGEDVEGGGLHPVPDRPLDRTVEDARVVVVHPEHEAAVDHDAEVVQAADHRRVVAVDVLPLALVEEIGAVDGLEADEQAAQARLHRLLQQAGPQDGLHRAGGLPQPSHPAHALEQGAGEAGVAEQVVVEEVQVAARQPVDLGQGRVDRLGVEGLAALEERLLVAEVAHVGAAARDHDGVRYQVQVAGD